MATMTIDVDRLNARFDLRDIASQHTTLHAHSGDELAGPCPRCGGTDRFYVSPTYFACRQCHPKRGDAIDLMQWLHGADFRSAVTMLDSSHTIPHQPQQLTATPKKTATPQLPTWATIHADHLAGFRKALVSPDCPGYEYMIDRGFAPETWKEFRAGYDAERNAIALPWFRGGMLTGIRYRLIAPASKQKLVSEQGSRFAGLLFGGQALPLPPTSTLLAQRYLVICEGELNAMSIWQAASRARVDALSIGSESATLPDSLLGIARRYRAVIVWMDKEGVARKHASALSALGFWSEGTGQKRDANDWLRDGALGDLLARLLKRVVDPAHTTALGYDLQDGGLS